MKNIIFCFLLLLLISGSVPAQTEDPVTGTVNRHDGFFLRMVLGIAQTELTSEMDFGGDMKMSGLGSEFRIQIGGTIFDDLILYGDLGGVVVSEPNIEWGGSSASVDNSSLTVSEFGAGLNYYFMPDNIYLAFSLTFPMTTLEFNNTKGESQTGFGAFLSLGKEWWVSDQWALGAAIFGSYGSMKDKGTDNSISVYSAGVLFSATLN